MSNKNLAAVTNELVQTYGNTAKNVITAYRVGNERAISYVDQSWAAAVKKAGSRLNAEVRNNALAAQKKVTAIYAQGVVLTSDSAEVAVNKTVALAGKGIEQVAANANRFEKATGLDLSPVAVAVVPAAQAATKVATQIEVRTSEFANKIAGGKVKAKVASVKRTVSKKVAPVAKKVAPVAKKAAPAAKKAVKAVAEAVAA